MNKASRNYLYRITTAFVAAGVIGSQIPSASGIAFAQGSYLDPDQYVKKSDVLAMNMKFTAEALAGYGILNFATAMVQKAAAEAAAEAAVAKAAAAKAAAEAAVAKPPSPATGSDATTPAPSGNPKPIPDHLEPPPP